jgi:uncharacterized membrane protein
MWNKWGDLVWPAVLALLALLFTIAGSGPGLLQAFLAFLLVAVLPGYAISKALFVTSRPLPAEMLVFTPALSLAATALSAFSLHAFGQQLAAGNLAVLLAATTTAGLLAAYFRRSRTGVLRRYPAFIHFSPLQVVLLGSAAILAVTAVVIASDAAATRPAEPFTQLWILPPEVGSGGSFRVGAANHEGQAAVYDIQVLADGREITIFSSVVVEDGGTYETLLDAGEIGPFDRLEVFLYHSNSPDQVYRQVSWRQDERQK